MSPRFKALLVIALIPFVSPLAMAVDYSAPHPIYGLPQTYMMAATPTVPMHEEMGWIVDGNFLSVEEVYGASGAGEIGLTPAQIATLTPTQIAALTLTQITLLTPVQIKAFLPPQIRIFSYTQFSKFSLAQVNSLTIAQVAALSDEVVSLLNYSQIGSFSSTQIAVLTPRLSSAQIALLSNKNGGNPISIQDIIIDSVGNTTPPTIDKPTGYMPNYGIYSGSSLVNIGTSFSGDYDKVPSIVVLYGYDSDGKMYMTKLRPEEFVYNWVALSQTQKKNAQYTMIYNTNIIKGPDGTYELAAYYEKIKNAITRYGAYPDNPFGLYSSNLTASSFKVNSVSAISFSSREDLAHWIVNNNIPPVGFYASIGGVVSRINCQDWVQLGNWGTNGSYVRSAVRWCQINSQMNGFYITGDGAISSVNYQREIIQTPGSYFPVLQQRFASVEVMRQWVLANKSFPLGAKFYAKLSADYYKLTNGEVLHKEDQYYLGTVIGTGNIDLQPIVNIPGSGSLGVVTGYYTGSPLTTDPSPPLTDPNLSTLTPTQIRALTLEQIIGLSLTQINSLTPIQVAAMSSAQLAAFTPAQVATLTPEQKSGLSAEQLAALNHTGGTPPPPNPNPNPGTPIPEPVPDGPPVFDKCANLWSASKSCVTGNGDCGTKVGRGATPDEAKNNADGAICVSPFSHGSIIDNHTFNHIHSGVDYLAPKTQSGAGCSSCGGGIVPGSADGDPRAGVVRIHRSRESFLPSSFGIGVYLCYDASLNLFDANGTTYVDCFDPNWMGARRYSPSGTSFKDAIYKSCKAFNLYDSSGNLTVSRANAVRGTLVDLDGSTVEFDLFTIDANTTGGRPTVYRGIDGSALITLTYSVAVNNTTTTPDEKRCIATAKDRYGNTVGFVYSTLPSGRLAITAASLPGGRVLSYGYDGFGNLISATLPNGDTSTFALSINGSGMFQEVFNDVGESGTHRNKTVYYSNNIAQGPLNRSDRPVEYNQSSMLVYAARNGSNELNYYGVTNPNNTMQCKIYEGGGRLRFIDLANDTKFKNWSIPAVLNAVNPYGSFTGTLEAHGHVAPYQNYAENRQNRSPIVTTPEGLVHNFTYDANGNYTSHNIGTKTDRHASDPRFNKPVLDVDFTGNAVLRAYDTQGNLVSEKTGWKMDASLPVGTTLPGVKVTCYSGPPLQLGAIGGIPGLAPTSVTGMPGIASIYNELTSDSVIQEGNLTVTQAGVRTFRLSSGYYGSRLVIDGQTVLTAYYTQASVSANVNLSAGVHTISVYSAGSGKNFSLTWAGPETTVNGVAVQQPIAQEYLSHATVEGELAVHPTSAAATKTWTYFPTGDARAGLLQSSVDAAGKVSQYAYDSSRRLTQMSQTGDSGSMVVMQTLTYDARGNLATTTDALGRTITYAYDDRDRRTKTSYGDGTTETVAYGKGINANLVVAQKDRNGSVTMMTYDTTGRLVTTTVACALADNDGNITTDLPETQWSVTTNTYVNGSTNVSRTVTDGKVTEYDYDYKDRVIATRIFPSEGKVLSTKTAYDANEVRFMEADTYGRRTFFAYRATDRMLVRQAQELTPGSLGNLTTDAAVLALTRDTSPNPAYVITDYTKDLEGRTTQETNPGGINTAYAHDAVGRTVQTTTAVGLPEAQSSGTTYDAAGRVVATTDALGRTTTTTYTPAGRTDTVTLPGGDTQRYTYYADGRTATVTDPNNRTSTLYYSMCCGRNAGSANALGQGTLNFYDGDGHVTYSVLVNDVAAAMSFGPNVPSAAIVSATTTRYDARGRAVASTRWLVAPTSVDPKNPPIATDATQGLTTTYEYHDNLNDPRFSPVLSGLTSKGVTLTGGSATVVTSPTGEANFTVQDDAGRAVASGTFRKP